MQSIEAPDRNGKTANIVQGFDGLDGYVTTGNKPYMGAIIGRYANRLAGGTFQLNGKTYHVPKNNGENALHGGIDGFNKKVWTGKEIKDGVELTYISKNGEEGFPGTLTTTVRYTLVGNELRIEYSATTDADTVVNLTNHSYFNLKGQGDGDILGTELKINAKRYTPVDKNLIPIGDLAPVAGTPFDFLKSTAIGSRINSDNEQLKVGGRLRPELGARWRREESDCGSGGLRADNRARARSPDRSAGNSVLHRQLPRWDGDGDGRQSVQAALRVLPRDAALSRFTQSSEVSDDGVETGRRRSGRLRSIGSRQSKASLFLLNPRIVNGRQFWATLVFLEGCSLN